MEYHHWLPELSPLDSAVLVCLLMFQSTEVINIDILHKLYFLIGHHLWSF